MEPGFRSPLLEFFRRGEVDRDIRLLAAQGALAPRAHEQLALLMLLVSDSDPEIAGAAEATLTAIPRASLASFLARSDVSIELRDFFARRGIEPAGVPAMNADQPMLDTSPPEPETGEFQAAMDGPADSHRAGEGAAAGAADAPLAVAGGDATATTMDGAAGDAADGAAEDAPEDEAKRSVTQKIASMTVAQRMSLAMKGSREERSILIRDPNKLVSASVLSSPKLTESEIEAIAKMANVSEDTLRIVGSNRAWVKNYNVALALVRNPKAPVALSMNLLQRLNDKDLRQLSTNRNIPEILRVTARKKVVIAK